MRAVTSLARLVSIGGVDWSGAGGLRTLCLWVQLCTEYFMVVVLLVCERELCRPRASSLSSSRKCGRVSVIGRIV